jgi:hypothetical protein
MEQGEHSNIAQAMEQGEHSNIAGGTANMFNHFGDQVVVSKKKKKKKRGNNSTSRSNYFIP